MNEQKSTLSMQAYRHKDFETLLTLYKDSRKMLNGHRFSDF